MKPFLKWVGGKGKLAPILQQYIPHDFNTYYEPFLGGGSFFFYLINNNNYTNKRLFLSDINNHLILCYTFIQRTHDKEFFLLIKLLESLEKNHSQTLYYKIRDVFNTNSSIKNYQKVAYFIYLNKTCFNGLFRVNSKGMFNVPLGTIKKNLKVFNQQNLIEIREKMRGDFSSHSFHEIQPCKGDFVYLDPPYYKAFGGYHKGSFDTEKLRLFCDSLNKKRVKFLMSNANHEDVKILFGSRYEVIELNTFGSFNRKIRSEILVRNYDG